MHKNNARRDLNALSKFPVKICTPHRPVILSVGPSPPFRFHRWFHQMLSRRAAVSGICRAANWIWSSQLDLGKPIGFGEANWIWRSQFDSEQPLWSPHSPSPSPDLLAHVFVSSCLKSIIPCISYLSVVSPLVEITALKIRQPVTEKEWPGWSDHVSDLQTRHHSTHIIHRHGIHRHGIHRHVSIRYRCT